MSHFDPWTGTPDVSELPSMAAQVIAVDQLLAAKHLTDNKETVLSEGFEVLAGVATCVEFGMVVPDWLAAAFLERWRAVIKRKAGDSWDSELAFGKPLPKGTNEAAIKRSMKNRPAVVTAVSQAIQANPDVAIDTAFWETIGQAVGEGKTNAQKLHAQAVRAGLAVTTSKQKELYSQG